MYILDTKKKTYLVDTGNGVQVLDNLIVGPDPNPYMVVTSTNIDIGNSINSHIRINGGICYKITQVTSGATYVLQDSDYFVEIVTPTCMSVVLPLASADSGCSYLISRAETNTNNNLFVVAQSGDDIDGRPTQQLRRAGMHIKLTSNGIDRWYIVG